MKTINRTKNLILLSIGFFISCNSKLNDKNLKKSWFGNKVFLTKAEYNDIVGTKNYKDEAFKPSTLWQKCFNFALGHCYVIDNTNLNVEQEVPYSTYNNLVALLYGPLGKLQKNNKKLQKELEYSKNDHEKLKKELEYSKNDHEKLKKELKDLKNSANELKRSYENYKKAYDEYPKKYEKLSEKKSELEKLNGELKTNILDLKEQIKFLKNNNKEHFEEKKTLLNNNGLLVNINANLWIKKNLIEYNLSVLKSEINKLKETNGKLINNNKNLIITKKKELEEYKKNNQKILVGNNTRLARLNSELQNKLIKREKEFEKLEIEIKKQKLLAGNNTKLATDNKTLQNQLKNMKLEQKKLDDIKKELNLSKEIIKSLKQLKVNESNREDTLKRVKEENQDLKNHNSFLVKANKSNPNSNKISVQKENKNTIDSCAPTTIDSDLPKKLKKQPKILSKILTPNELNIESVLNEKNHQLEKKYSMRALYYKNSLLLQGNMALMPSWLYFFNKKKETRK